MGLYDRIKADYMVAFKTKDILKKDILNYVIAQLKYKQIEIQKDLSDEDVINVIKKEIKSRKESMEFAEKAWKIDEYKLDQAKISIIETYLPIMMSREQLEWLIRSKIVELWISDHIKQRWVLIGAIMKDHKAEVDWSMMNDIINKL